MKRLLSDLTWLMWPGQTPPWPHLTFMIWPTPYWSAEWNSLTSVTWPDCNLTPADLGDLIKTLPDLTWHRGHRGQKLSQCREVRGLARSHRSGEVAEGCGQATQVWRGQLWVLSGHEGQLRWGRGLIGSQRSGCSLVRSQRSNILTWFSYLVGFPCVQGKE